MHYLDKIIWGSIIVGAIIIAALFIGDAAAGNVW